MTKAQERWLKSEVEHARMVTARLKKEVREHEEWLNDLETMLNEVKESTG